MLTQLLAKECSNCVHGDGAELHDNISRPTTSCLNFRTVGCSCLLTIRAYYARPNIWLRSSAFTLSSTSSTWELGPDEFYNVTPDYFEWDDQKSGGIYRRMIQRFSRRLANQQPAFTDEWIDCTAAQVLTEIEQRGE